MSAGKQISLIIVEYSTLLYSTILYSTLHIQEQVRHYLYSRATEFNNFVRINKFFFI